MRLAFALVMSPIVIALGFIMCRRRPLMGAIQMIMGIAWLILSILRAIN